MKEFLRVIESLQIFLAQDPPPEQGKVNVFIDVTDARALVGGAVMLRTKLELAIEVLKVVDCKCTIAERDSGHRVECYMADVTNALALIEKNNG